MEKPRISVIVPVYNVEAYLRECVESILSQSVHELEIILIDDGSQDGSPALCDQLAQEDNRVRVIHQSNGGASIARNHGLDEAKGEYITFVDADDYLLPGALGKLWNLVEAHPGVDIISASIEINGRTIGPTSTSPTYIDNLRIIRDSTTYELFSFFAIAKLFRSTFIREWKLYFIGGIVMGEDTLFSFFAQKHAQSVAICHDPIYYYRQNESSVMHEKDFTRHGIAMFQVARIIARNMDNNGLYGQTRFLLDRLEPVCITRLYNDSDRVVDMQTIKKEIKKTYNTIKRLPVPFPVKAAAWRLILPWPIANSKLLDFIIRGIKWISLKRLKAQVCHS